MNRGTGYPGCMQDLIEEFSKMPGIGIRTAERLAFYVLGADPFSVQRLSESVRKVKETVRYCKKCFNLSEQELCRICSDPTRDQSIICVVEEPKDINAIEKAGIFRGVYHVLLGALSPLDGVGPEDIKIPELIARVDREAPAEVIVATTSDTEGEATSLYLAKNVKSRKTQLTRLAQGMPMGSELEFTDRATLIRAIEARHEIKS